MAEPGPARRRPFKREKGSRMGLWAAVAIAVLLALYVALVAGSRPTAGGDRLRLDRFTHLVGEGRIREARVLEQDGLVVGTYQRDDGSVGRYHTAYLTSNGDLTSLLVSSNVPTTVDHQFSKRLVQPATLVLPALIVVVVFIYLILSYSKGTGLFSVRSGARRLEAEDDKASFADVGGQDAAVAELREIKEFLTDPERFASLGAQVPKGILLYGPPGCGKTLLARAVAGESGAAFYSISGSDFVELYVGVGAARVRDLFREARAHAPAIVFIDELDAVGRRRRSVSATGSQEEQEQALNQILTEMDGFSPMQGIIVMAATNRPDVLDPALLRPGRFDRSIGLERPDEAARLAVLQVRAQDKPMDADVDLAGIARRAVGLSGADLAGVVNEGALLAARAGRHSIGQVELQQALDRVLETPDRQRRLSMRDRSFGRAGTGRRVSFADVAGLEEAVDELAEVRDYLADPERYLAMGARPPAGFLLVGPPGCGKTLLARAVAGEANAAFFSVAATEFVEVLAGEGAGRVRDLFAEARAAAPAMVFLDEIDAVGARRGAAPGGGQEREQTLNQILVELDGFDSRSGVTVLAATNRPEILDEALVRPGRFSRVVTLSPPDRAGRVAILGLHATGKPLAGDVDLGVVAGLTQGFSGADLANLLNEAALLSARRHLSEVTMAIVTEAVERTRMGVAGARELSAEERSVVAYHEVGHALVGMALTGARVPYRISIVARGNGLGATWHLDQADRAVHTRSHLLDEMARLLGGRAAEEVVFGEAGSGSADDVRRVTDLARRMVCELGMSEALGPVSFGDGTGTPWSEQAAATVHAEVRRLVEEAHGRARDVLTGSRPALDRVAGALLEREALSAGEVERLLEETPAPPPAASPAAVPTQH